MKICPTCRKQFDDSVKFCPDDASQLIIAGQAERSDPFLGVVLGAKYRIEEKIGEGGMGQIYMARHVTLKKRYAVKMLNSDFSRNQEAVERFRREATTAGELEHPNIINVTDIDYTEDGRAYIVMEFLDGRELRHDLSASGALPLDRLVRIFTQVCRALDAAHSKGIVHRDLKPENIFLVDLQDQPDTVKLLDFGISKIKSATASHLTQTGMVIGTPHYMAPEQAKGDRDIDHRADIFALGAILYEATTGQVPANGETATAILMKIILEEPAAPSLLNPSITPQLEAVIRRAMAKDRDMRFQSCGEMSDALQNATGILLTHSVKAAHVPTGMAYAQAPSVVYPQAASGTYGQAQQPTSPSQAVQAQPMYGTAQTPMSWTGSSSAARLPPKRKGSAAWIAIPLVLILVVLLGGAAVAALLLTGVLGGSRNDQDSNATSVLATTSPGETAKPPVVAPTPAETAPTSPAETNDKVKIKFSTDPEGADVVLKIGTHERTLCVTTCTHEFNVSDKEVTILLRKDGYREEEIAFAPDFNKELITGLDKTSSKKKSGGGKTVVKELPGLDTTPTTKPSTPTWEIKTDPKDKPQPADGGTQPGKKPIIKPIEKPPEGTPSKKGPAIKIISSQ